jgi:hypothetical protein
LRPWAWILVSVLLAGQAFPEQAAATKKHWPTKVLRRLLAPFRSNPFLQSNTRPCGIGLANCFLPPGAALPQPAPALFESKLVGKSSSRLVTLELRTEHRGPWAHHWLELQGSAGAVTIGFGPATLPFIDAGQVSLQDQYGNIRRISGMHPLPWMALPPINYHYARSPGDGHAIGKPIPLTAEQSEALVRKIQHVKYIGPYIPIFHDCRTYACALQASAQGRSRFPCYLLFKGYW